MEFKIFIATPKPILQQLRDAFGPLPNIFIARAGKGKYSALDLLYEYDYDFDAMIIDLIQPRGDGLSLTEEVRWNQKLRGKDPCPIIWLSETIINPIDQVDTLSIAYRDLQILRACVSPCDLPELVEELRELVVKSVGDQHGGSTEQFQAPQESVEAAT